MMELKRKGVRNTVHSNVRIDPERDVFMAGPRSDPIIITMELAENQGWLYDKFANELYETTFVDVCKEHEVKVMYDEKEEEFYCPVCNNE